MSDLEKRANSFAERNDEMVLGESVRMIIAAQENNERALKDAYEEALDEALKKSYIFETNQAPDGVGFGFFVTNSCSKSHDGKDKVGSSYLLTYQEKQNIFNCLRTRVAEVTHEKQRDALVNRGTQEEMFRFLFRHEESDLGCLTEPLSRQFQQPTAYGENRIKVITPPEKLGAIIGYIGDLMTPD